MPGVVLFLLFLLAAPLLRADAAENLFTGQEEILNGLELTYRLKLHDARKSFEAMTATDPSSPAGHFYAAAIGMGLAESEIRWRVMARMYTGNAPEKREQRDTGKIETELNTVIEQCDTMLERSPDDFEALFYKAGAHAFLARMNVYHGNYFTAFRHGKKSAALFDQLHAAYPERGDTMIGPGIYKYYVGRLPGPLRWMVSLLGLEGTKAEGLALTEKAYERAVLSRMEAADFLSRIYGNHEGNGAKALEWADAQERLMPASAAVDLNRVVGYRLLGDRAKEEESVRRLHAKLADVDPEVRAKWEPLLEFADGWFKWQKGDRDGAAAMLRKVAATPGADPWLKAEARRKLQRMGAKQ